MDYWGFFLVAFGAFTLFLKLTRNPELLASAFDALDKFGEMEGWAIRVGFIVVGIVAIAYAQSTKNEQNRRRR